ncbi:MAG: hypothetical protein MUC65_07165 [Pontiellaceae bacterium]|nr:hypothetical protein [Pontiellaceae bacterium]
MKSWKKTIFIVIGVLLLIISFQNLDPLPFRLLFWKVKMRPIVLLPLILLIGFFAGHLARKKRS